MNRDLVALQASAATAAFLVLGCAAASRVDSSPSAGAGGADAGPDGLATAGAVGKAPWHVPAPSSDEAAANSRGGAAAQASRAGAPAMGGRGSIGDGPGATGSAGDVPDFGGAAGQDSGAAGATSGDPSLDGVIEVDWKLPGIPGGSVVLLTLTEAGVEVERRVSEASQEQFARSLPEEASVGVALLGPEGELERSYLSSAACPVLAVSTREPLRVPANYGTIQRAIDDAEPGDTVLVAPGTYRESVTLRTGVTLRGEDPRTTVWDGAGEGQTLVDFSGAREVTIRGFTFRNVGLASGCAEPTDVFACAGGWYAAAVYADGHGMQDEWPCRTATAFIVDNVFEGNTIAVMTYFLSQAVLANNLFIGNEHAVVANHHGDSANLFLNNVFFENQTAIALQASHSHVHDNIFVGGSAVVRDFVQTGEMGCNLLSLASLAGETLDTTDPMFLDATAGDFRLAPGSPAIDAGCFAEVLSDRDGSPPDLGLFGGPFAAE